MSCTDLLGPLDIVPGASDFRSIRSGSMHTKHLPIARLRFPDGSERDVTEAQARDLHVKTLNDARAVVSYDQTGNGNHLRWE